MLIIYYSYHCIIVEMQKVVQELYGLINYGELKRRVGFCNDKNWSKLYEMIYHGSTKVRSKGKLWKVKTPHCRALRKLNCLEGIIFSYCLKFFLIQFVFFRYNWRLKIARKSEC